MDRKDKTKADPIEDILESVNGAYKAGQEGNEAFNANKRMIYESALTKEDIQALSQDGKSIFSIPVILPQLNHQLKNIQDSIPSASVEALHPDYEPLCEFLTDKVNDILEANYYPGVLCKVAEDAMAGGKGIFEMKTDYIHRYSMDQRVVLKAVEDPTQIFFDPSSQSPCREDANFCFKLVPVDEKTFKREFPDKSWQALLEEMRALEEKSEINWVYTEKFNDQKRIVICYYYYKETEKRTLYKTEKGQMTWDKPASPKEIIGQKDCVFERFWRMTFCGTSILEDSIPLNFDCLPFIYVGGNEQVINGKKRPYPFAEGAIDAQRFKSIALSYFVSAFQNNQAGKIILPEESNIPGTTDLALKNVTQSNLILYKSMNYNEEASQLFPSNPPQYIPPAQLPPHYMQAYNEMSASIQEILGSHYASLDQANMSGTALYHLADFMNAAISPFMKAILYATRQLTRAILSSFHYLLTEEEKEHLQALVDPTLEIEIDNMDYFDIAIQPGINYKLQQQYATEQLLKLAELCPSLKEWLNAEGIPLLLENIPLNKKSQIMSQFEQFQLKQKKMMSAQSQTPNPELMIAEAEKQKAQASMLKAQAELMDSTTKRAETTAEIHGNTMKNLLKVEDSHLKEKHMHVASQNERMNQLLEAAKLHTTLAKMKTDENLAHQERRARNSREVVRHLKDQIFKKEKEPYEGVQNGQTYPQTTEEFT